MKNKFVDLKKVMPKKQFRLIKLISGIAAGLRMRAFLVGGPVRDIILGIDNDDLDILIEGSAQEVAGALARKTGGRAVLHERFGTATVFLSPGTKAPRKKRGGIKVDLATARKETYEHPAALPRVEPGTIYEDLFRRDFTINAMAVSLNEDIFGVLMDLYGGQDDLAAKKIRILHDKSFIDDPTRIFRAVRFEQRLGFRIEPRTEALIAAAVRKNIVKRVGRDRLREEFVLILKEKRPDKVIGRLDQLGLLRVIHPKLHFSAATARFFDSVEKRDGKFYRADDTPGSAQRWLVYLTALLDSLGIRDYQKACLDLGLRRGETASVLSFKKEGPSVLALISGKGRIPASGLYKRLKPLSAEALLAMMAKARAPAARKRISDFLKKYKGVRLNITGTDLLAMGLKPGPQFKKILEAALYAKLDRGLAGKKQELDFVRRLTGRK